MERKRNYAGILALLMASSASSLAWAQAAGGQGAVQSPSAQNSQVLGEIVVTATRRSEQISRVPVSIAAFDEKALLRSGAKSVSDIAALTPGIEFDNSAGFAPGTLTNIAIRGVNSTVGPATTGVYLDDTPLQVRITGLGNFGAPFPVVFDLNRVEVDRGPQGTLFGAGAEGGTVRFITNTPSLSRFSGTARAEVAGALNGAPSYEAGVAAGGPIIQDKLGFRASVWTRTDGGYINRIDPFSGARVEANANATNSQAYSLAVAAEPADWLTVTPSIYFQSVHNHDSSAFYENASDPGAGKFNNGRLLRQPNTVQFALPSLKLEARLGWATLTSITSYLDRRGRAIDDFTTLMGALGAVDGLGPAGYGSPNGPEYPTSYADAAPARMTAWQHQFSQELRLSSDPNARLSWVSGLYFSYSTQDDGEVVLTSFGDQPNLQTDVTTREQQIAAFGQLDYRIIDKLKLTLGLRVASMRNSFVQLASGPANFGVPSPATGSEKDTPITPKAGLSYQLDAHNLFYVSVAKGFRPGGANQPVPSFCPYSIPPSYQSDSVLSYEVGGKSRLFNNRLTLDASAFHIDWSNIQQPIYLGLCGFQYLTNTGAAKSDGFDIASQLVVTDSLKLGLSVGYNDARFTKDVTFQGQPVVQKGDAIGLLPDVASPWIVTVSADYSHPIGTWGEGYVHVSEVYHSRNPGPFSSLIPGSTSFAPDIPANPATNRVDLRFGVNHEGWDASIFVNNVLNSHPSLGRFQDAVGASIFTDYTFRPLTAGVTLNKTF